MGWAGTAVAITMFLVGVFLLGIGVWKLRQAWRTQTPEMPVEHLERVRPDSWQARHRQAVDRPYRIPAKHQADPGAATARQSRARMTRRSPGK